MAKIQKYGGFTKFIVLVSGILAIIILVNSFGSNLADAEFAIGGGVTVQRSLMVYSLTQVFSSQIGGDYSALRITLRDGYEFITPSGANPSEIWVLLKNRTSGGVNNVGAIVYRNEFGEYVFVSWPAVISDEVIGNNIQFIRAGAATNRETIAVRIIGQNLLANRGAATNGIVTTSDMVLGRYPRVSHWRFFFAFGTGVPYGSAGSLDAEFREQTGNVTVGRPTLLDNINATTTTVPLCSSRGSCINNEIQQTRAELLYATQPQSTD